MREVKKPEERGGGGVGHTPEDPRKSKIWLAIGVIVLIIIVALCS